MTNTAIIALLQEARVKIKGYASSDALRLVEEAIAGLSGRMSHDEFANKMLHLAGESNNDTETIHVEADTLMCEVLKQHGYERGVEAFEDMYKWYA